MKGLPKLMNSELQSPQCLLQFIIGHRAKAFPVWRDLSHFKHVVNINFNDGSKLEDLSKVCKPELDYLLRLLKYDQDYPIYCSQCHQH